MLSAARGRRVQGQQASADIGLKEQEIVATHLHCSCWVEFLQKLWPASLVAVPFSSLDWSQSPPRKVRTHAPSSPGALFKCGEAYAVTTCTSHCHRFAIWRILHKCL